MARAHFTGLALLLIAAAVLPCAPAAAAAPAGAPLVMRSALLRVTATASPGSLALEVTRRAGHELITAPGAVSVTLDGHPLSVSAQPDGSWRVSTHGVGGGTHALDVLVSHDGVRELLEGRLTLPGAHGASGGGFESHTMLAWWVLNIAVVLIAVIAISRRRA